MDVHQMDFLYTAKTTRGLKLPERASWFVKVGPEGILFPKCAVLEGNIYLKFTNNRERKEKKEKIYIYISGPI